MPFNAIIQPAAGGGVTAPTLESGLTLDENETAQDFDLVNNDGSNPSAVDLSFSGNILKAAAFDSGTASSPSYVIEASATRTISLIRGSGAPDTVGTDSDCTVTALLADGNTATQSINVEASRVFATRLVEIGASPTYQFATNSLTNSGSSGGTFVQTNGTLAAETTRAAFAAHFLHTNSSDSLTMSSQNFINFRRDASQDRTWIQAWQSNQNTYATSGKYLSPYGDNSSTAPGGYLYVYSAGERLYNYKDSSNYVSLDTSYSHTGGGSSELLKTYGTYESLCVVALIWDSAAGTITARWKQEGHGSGHSYYTVSAPAQTNTDTSWSLDLIGRGSSTSDAPNIKLFHYSVSDVAITEANFTSLLGTVGL